MTLTSRSKSQVFFIITVDTEADNAWTSPEKLEMNNFNEIPRFQELCEKYGIIPSYLLTYEYATYEPAVNYLKRIMDSGKCEIGHHLHVWSTPPFSNERNGIDLDWLHAYQYELPDELFEEKASALQKAIYYSFNIYPKVHRAGRWGIDERSIEWLADNKFILDTSIVPGIDYTNNLGRSLNGPSFKEKPDQPYYWKTSSGKTILEVPVTTYQPWNKLNLISKYTQNKIINKTINRISPTHILRPNPDMSFSYYKKILSKPTSVYNLMLHSSELAMNCSPYTDSVDKYNKVWQILEFIFQFVVENNYTPLPISKISKPSN